MLATEIPTDNLSKERDVASNPLTNSQKIRELEASATEGFMNFIMPLVTAVMEEETQKVSPVTNKKRALEVKEERKTPSPKKNQTAEDDEVEEKDFNEEEEEAEEEMEAVDGNVSGEEDEDYHDSSRGPRKRVRKDDDSWKPKRLYDESQMPANDFNSKRKKEGSRKAPKKRRVKSIAQSRSIFKKAVLKVFLDQRKKGVKTLSLSQVWTLIVDAGLIKTMGKTPIQSVSCALSQDVLRGEESSFVRVGKGLYALKDDIDEKHLEKYLSSLDSDSPIPSKSPTSEYSSYDDEEEDISGEGDEVSSPAPDDRTTQEIPKNHKWIGEPIYTNGDKTYYSAVQVGKQTYRVGSCAYLEHAEDYDKPYLARIASLYQDKSNMLVECVWYSYPEEDISGSDSQSNEVFLSSSRDILTVDSLLSPKVEVLSNVEFDERQKQGKSMKDVFFCYRSISSDTKKPENLSIDDKLLSIVARQDQLPAKSVIALLLTELQYKGVKQTSKFLESQSNVASATSTPKAMVYRRKL